MKQVGITVSVGYNAQGRPRVDLAINVAKDACYNQERPAEHFPDLKIRLVSHALLVLKTGTWLSVVFNVKVKRPK